MEQRASTWPRVLVLNGGSSSGKSTLARQLQEVLPGVWLRLGVDVLVEACPPRLLLNDGLEFRPDGSVVVGAAFTETEDLWMAGVARIAELGGQILIEDNFVSGPSAQIRWSAALSGVPAVWIGVRCAAAEAARRESARADRTAGMASDQAERVHAGITYDLEVHTDRESIADNADFVRRRFFTAIE